MQQIEMSKQFQEVIRSSERRVQRINYVLAVLLAVTLIWAMYASWRTSLQEKIESIKLVQDSVLVVGPTALCPGDRLTIRYTLAIDGVGVVIADDSVKFLDRTVKFSTSKRDIIDQSETRTYEDSWRIPVEPEAAISGQMKWIPGEYVRYISVAASNIYVSRYTDPVRFQTKFSIRPDC